MSERTVLDIESRLAVAVDAANWGEADTLTGLLAEAGAINVSFGTRALAAYGIEGCSAIAAKHELSWVADAKLLDDTKPLVATVRTYTGLDYPPTAITMHTVTSWETMREAQNAGREYGCTVRMLGISVMPSIDLHDAVRIFGDGATPRAKALELTQDAADAGLDGIVCLPQDLQAIKNGERTKQLFTMVRDYWSETPEFAKSQMIRGGGDLVEIGPQITEAEYPKLAFTALVRKIRDDMQHWEA